MTRTNRSWPRRAAGGLGVLASLSAAALTFHPQFQTGRLMTQFVPFAFVRDIVGGTVTHAVALNIVGNLLLFTPAALFYRVGGLSPPLVVGIIAAQAVLVEFIQLLTGQRVVDIDDVILPTLGAILVVMCYEFALSVKSEFG